MTGIIEELARKREKSRVWGCRSIYMDKTMADLAPMNFIYHFSICLVCLFVCLGGRQGEAD